MNGRKFYSFIFVWLCLVLLTHRSFSQTITTSTITPSTLCSGGNITVTFTTTGSFSATNAFSAQLSNASGAFDSPTVIGSVTSASATAISATIPDGTANGTYKIRIVSSTPTVTGNAGSPNLIINVPSAPGTTSPPTYCQGASATALSATPSSGGTLNWYGITAVGGTASTSATVPSTANAGTVNYYVSQTVNGCEGPRAAIAVTVQGTPSTPGVTSHTLCQSNTTYTLSATPSTGGSLNWYGTASTGGTASIANQNISVATPGTFSYYVSQSINGCEGSRAAITVTVKQLPTAPTATTPAPVCQGASANPLSATPSSGGSLNWYGTAETGGTGSSVANTPSTTNAGTFNYYVSQTVNGCEGPRTTIPVEIKANPSPPGTIAAGPYCRNAVATALVATASTGGSLNWYGKAATGGTSSTSATVPSTATPGTTSYYVSQTVNGCEGPRAAIDVTVFDTPSAPGVSSVSVCQSGTPYTLSANASSGGTLNWYNTAATGGTASNENQSVSVANAGTFTYYVSQSINGCEGPRAAITVTVKPLPAVPTTTTPAPVCQGAPADPISATASAGGSLNWYGTAAIGGTGSGVANTPSTANAGTFNYYVSQTVNGCEGSRTAIPVVIKVTPAAPTVSPIAFCKDATPPVLTAGTVAGATLRWFGTDPTGGIPDTKAPVPPNNTPQTIIYYVSQILDGCESGLGASSGRAALSVRIKPLPDAPTVTNVSYCNTSAASPLTATGSNLKWYDSSDTPLNGTPTPSTGSVGDLIFKVTQTVEECEGPKATLTITIKSLPIAPGVTNLNYCLPTQDQPAQNVSALTASGLALQWFNSDGNAYPDAPTPSITQVGTQTYLVHQTVNGCTGPKATLQVTVRTTAVPETPQSLLTYCINAQAVPLQATAETGGSLHWIDPYGRVSNDAPTPSTLNTSIKPEGDAFYVYQVGSNSCYSERATIKVIVYALPTLSLTAPVPSVNLGLRAPLELKFTSIPPFSYTLTDGISGVVNQTDTTISVLPRGNTTYQIVTVRNACGVGLPGNPATATITVQVPTVTTTALTTATLCAGTSLSVPFTTTGTFTSGNAFRAELISVADTSKKFLLTGTTLASPITAPVPLTMVGGQYYVRIKADNPEVGVIGSNSPTTLTISPQPNATLAGTQNIYEGYPASLTLTLVGDSPWNVTYADSVQSYSATATSNPYAFEVRPTRTTTYQLVSISNVCGSGLVSGSAVVTVLPLLGIENNPLDPLVKTYPVPTTSILTVELDLSLVRDPAILLLTDMSGKPILQQTTRNQKHELDLTSQPGGIYLLRIQVGDRQTVRKLLKE